jgi:hypothetical protein
LHLSWVFREQPIEDTGIAHVEVVDGDRATGTLLAFQIKGGDSWSGSPARWLVVPA